MYSIAVRLRRAVFLYLHCASLSDIIALARRGAGEFETILT